MVCKITLNNKTFKIPVIKKIGYNNLFMSEKWMISLLKQLTLIENDVFFDVGINIGQTLIKLKSVDEKIIYYGFEPNSECVSYVKELCNINHFRNINIIPAGISVNNEIGELLFYQQNPTDACASIVKDFRPDQEIFKKEYVPLMDIESIHKSLNFPKISILKIDVEGAELEVLKSFENIILKDYPIIMMEILPAYNEQNQERIKRQNETEEILKKIEYVIYRVIKNNSLFLGFKKIDSFGIHSDLNACEYVFVPKTKNKKFETLNKKFLNINNE